MAYQLKSVSVRTNNSESGMKIIGEIWADVGSGKLPIMFDSEHNFLQGISPISKYSNYESNENGDYDISIVGVSSDFFGGMEQGVAMGEYKKYDEAGDDMVQCTKTAWGKVWNEQKAGDIQRAFTEDYESTVPAEYAKDGKAHCYLYIAIK